MPVRTFTINGKLVSASEDETILDVAREHGIAIPTLCHVPGLSDTGACRLCLVEVTGASRLQPACMTPVVEGMEVTTDSEKLKGYRRLIVELLLAERNHVCSVCVANTHCELQDLAVSMELHHVRFEHQSPLLRMDASHPRFAVDHNRCVLCTRCVRACDEIEGAHTWDVMGRGHESLVITDLNQPWGEAESCTSCGKCVRICPTGALFEKGRAVTEGLRDWEFVNYLKTARERKLWIRREE
ncbi:MAG TPA: bidirectional hydrogenase complex protein HoxU [Vicinamibacterales bacterium]|nr:bidirectional hydrogenase complex protein HoxU [Vicinamibacterales bacterium]